MGLDQCLNLGVAGMNVLYIEHGYSSSTNMSVIWYYTRLEIRNVYLLIILENIIPLDKCDAYVNIHKTTIYLILGILK